MIVGYHPEIVLTDLVAHYPPESLEALTQSGVTFVDAEQTGGNPMDAICEAEALLVTWFDLTAEVIAQLRHCKVIIRIGVGYDNIDVEAAWKRGIPVCNVPDYCQGEVADHAMALALALARALPFLDRCVRHGPWLPNLPYPIAAFETMSFGVLGYGRIGRSTIARARGFGFQLLACDPYLPETEFPADVRRCTLEELLTNVDILSLHVPLTAETRHLLNAGRLARMKPTALLINTSRGAVVETEALVEALEQRRLAAAGLDVFEEEPLPPEHPLLSSPYVLTTPHYAWHSRESRVKLYVMAVEEALRGVRGEPLRSCVNGVQPRRV
jgi:D-3-phosphoglycerate dehydrogenase / 2-oxoglutarate reductase